MINTVSTHGHAPRAHAAAGSVPSLAQLVSRFGAWAAVARQRRDLAAMDDAILRDIGLTREEAANEASRPFWDAPSHWMRPL